MNFSGQLDVIDLTTLARVKAMMPASVADTSQDALIDSKIREVSADIGRYIGWHLSAVERTEVYELARHARVLRLDAKPVTALTSLKESYRIPDDWSTVGATSASLYNVNLAGGWLRLTGRRSADPSYVQVTYTGGFGATTQQIIDSFPELSHACDLQVKYLLERLATIGGNVTTIPGASTSFSGKYGLHTEVMRLISQHRRGRA